MAFQKLTETEIDNLFSYHESNDEQLEKYEAIRSKAKELALVIVESTTVCPDQTAAIRKLRETVMTANAAIALGNY